ncbi:MAG: thiamine-phosphate pyrophosphorylase [Endomicrobia bacterium]|nr:thiamine-phosphate pyrophosphorylase [Endomicrobiia bacterium]MCL2506488.1 thiamine-phosphate pyrophosphorylase [Endomicrobiia bacterium]
MEKNKNTNTKKPVILNLEKVKNPAVNSNLRSSISTLRILDANLNRCREGLRVVEDSLRYVLNDGALYKKIRNIRHNTDKILRSGYASLIKERDSITDSGRKMPETIKKNLSDIIIANFKRAQESLRVLEEYSKAIFPENSPLFKKQRYAAYNLEKAVYSKYKKMFTK